MIVHRLGFWQAAIFAAFVASLLAAAALEGCAPPPLPATAPMAAEAQIHVRALCNSDDSLVGLRVTTTGPGTWDMRLDPATTADLCE